MKWYYANEGKQTGPVEEADFQSLVSSGRVRPDTLVWREGMANWAPYSEAAAAFTEKVETAPSSARASFPRPAVQSEGASAGTASSSQAAGGVICSECGGTFPIDQVIRLEGRFVCENCKPLAVQKLREGVSSPGEMVYAGFWIRVVAKILDNILLQIAYQVLLLPFKGMSQNEHIALAYIVSIVVGAAYNIYFLGSRGATPGKMALKLRVVRPDGSAISYGRATGRFFAEILSGLTLGIGYLMVAFDDEKRALHDRICDTRVIRS